MPGEPAGLGWLPDGRLLVVARKPRTVLRLEADGTLVQHGDLSPIATFHGNDMVVCADGRAYVGNFGFDLDRFIEERGASFFDPPPSPGHRARPRRPRRDGPRGRRGPGLSQRHGGHAGRWDPHRGRDAAGPPHRLRPGRRRVAERRRVWAEIDRCSPDGICLDADGCIWVANAVRPQCLLVAEGGEVVDRVTTTQHCFACMLGGADRRTLFS